ncbi:hypothetical protein SFSGTM_11370 [Sulfuriferula nivalis]|uniref:Tetratricopeptide repeat protein n=2 Tax=Sulfuriferula nivalis TaxID=2675298 RepID=A0A809RF38_9PROT|nr:hypothetical protein SFSGTM_11370 [Sulfuriferula nivalis]
MHKSFKRYLPSALTAIALLSTVLLGNNIAFADSLGDSIAELQHGWAKAYYLTPEPQKISAFENLATKSHQIEIANPGRAEPLVWEAIVLSSYAKFEGGLGALNKVKAARDLLVRAEKIQPDVLGGSIYTSLGSLYYKVPHWPISFGDKDKAREYLVKAIKINPNGIDANYFYGDFLLEQGDYTQAKIYLEKAMSASPRPGREDADQGRRIEVSQLLEKLKLHS